MFSVLFQKLYVFDGHVVLWYFDYYGMYFVLDYGMDMCFGL